MNERTLRPGNVAAGAVVIGGALIVVLPQHARSIVQLVIVTSAAAAALYALAASVPPSGWISPFRWMSPFGREESPARGGRGRDDLALIRSRLSGWRKPIEGGPPLPPETLGLLQPLIRRELGLDGDADDEARLAPARRRVSPLTLAVLAADPRTWPSWFRPRPPNRDEVASVVGRVLDDLDRLAGAAEAEPSIDPRHPRDP